MRELRKAWERWSGILSVPQPAVGFFGGCRGVAYGLWMVCHGPALVLRYPQFFTPMAAWAPLWVWGSVVCGLGFAQLLAQGFGDSGRLVRRVCAMSACVGWLSLCFLYWQGDPHSLGIPLLLCDAVAAGWAFLRLGDTYGGQGNGVTP